MTRGALLIIIPLLAFLGAAIYLGYRMWETVGGDAGMSGNGIAAMIIGVIGTLVLGGALMALVFYSSRRGYDDAADLKSRPPEDR